MTAALSPVRVVRVDTAARTLTLDDGTVFPCTIGRSGPCPAEAKREGDGHTPLGRWPIRGALLRPGRIALNPSPRARATQPIIPAPAPPASATHPASGTPAANAPAHNLPAPLAGAPAIPWRWTRPGDGWCDDAADPAYNRPVMLPRATSHEALQRDDEAYDIVIVLGHNDAPPVPGRGSAIFWHLWRPLDDDTPRPTEGCIAIDRAAMEAILPRLRPDTMMEIG